MKKQEKEIVIGQNRLYLREDNILHETIVGYIDYKTATELYQAGSQLRSMVDGKVDTLTNLENIVTADPKSIDMAKAAIEDKKVRKVAFVGENPVAVFVAAQFMSSTKKRNLAFFKIEEEALQWLKIRDTE
ncbi:hypothetical protein ACFLXZ_01745 [Chloroflexota bacterium]